MSAALGDARATESLMLRLKEGWPRCDKTGWLSKQAHDSDEWKRVWVVLKGCLLLLFEDATVRRPATASQSHVPQGPSTLSANPS